MPCATSPRARALRTLVFCLAIAVPLVGIARRARAQSVDAGQSAEPAEPPDPAAEPGEELEVDAGPPLAAAPAVVVQRLIPDASAPVVTGRGINVTAGEVYLRVEDEPEPTQRDLAMHPGLVDAIVDRIVADRLLANEARRLGLENDPGVRAAVERALVARLRATVINPASGTSTDVTDEQVRAFYEAHPDRFHTPARRSARLIFVTNRRDADRILRLARATGRNARDFRDLMREYNTDPEMIRRNGEVRDLRPDDGGIDPAVRRAIYAVRAPGQMFARPVAAQWHGTRGYFIVRLTAARPAVTRTLEDAASWIRLRLLLERRVRQERDLVTRLANQAGVSRVPTSQIVRVTTANGSDAGALSVDAGQP